MKLHLVEFADEQAAIGDEIISQLYTPPMDGGGYVIPGGWDSDTCFPNESVYVSQALQPGFWMIIAKANSDTTLAQHSACRLAWDNESAVILGGTYTGNDMSALFVSPVPAGAYNPWNGAAPE
ncbi:hypothetical protein [Bradyrhizobium sp. PRIMUS42]|uniref:hypothetical protein n=1 Tax=Bradyrhizobium sp. PRIMUS42 TaxID=2908926 RepID=UPI001FF15C87|nr:hypothetical protein [Bradyrhizobium sp. PRIMUS42]MCJ9729547.1 hypothetical protein [Bradyrhizobium sp. PRIMUS42]